MVDGRETNGNSSPSEPILGDTSQELFAVDNDNNNNDNNNNNNNSKPEVLSLSPSFEYPSKDAKKAIDDDLPVTKKIDNKTMDKSPVNTDELLNVDDSNNTKPEMEVTSSFEYPSKEAKQVEISTTTTTFEYPSQETKKDVAPEKAVTDTIDDDDMDDLFCDVDDDDDDERPKAEPTSATCEGASFQYPSKEAKQSNAAKETMDMDDLFCDVDDDDDDNAKKDTETQPTPQSTTSFKYPSKDAKKPNVEKITVNKIEDDDDMDDLFCDVDDDNAAKSPLPPTSVTTTKSTTFEYPSQEAKKTEKAPVNKIEDGMDDLFCDVDDDNAKPEAKKALLEKAPMKIDDDDDMDDLFCDVDDNGVPKPLPPPSAVATAKSTTFVYRSREAKTAYPSQQARSDLPSTESPASADLDAPTTHRMNRSNRNRYESDDDGDEDDDEFGTDHRGTAATANNLTYDNLSHRVKAQMTHRQSRHHDIDSDEDDEGDSDNDDDHHTRRSSQVTLDSTVYNSVGAVAVYRTGVVSQRPAVLTQAELHGPEPQLSSKEFERRLPLGTDDVIEEETWIDATVTSMPVQRMSGSGTKKPNTFLMDNANVNGKSVDLPWYKSRFVWVMIAILVVALVVIITVAVVVGGKNAVPETLPEPTMAPLEQLRAQLKVQAFEKHIGSIPDVATREDAFEAYKWLTQNDEITIFSDNMSEDDVGIMKTRYTLAVVYFSLGGKTWNRMNGWLEGSLGHCGWAFIDCRPLGVENFVPTYFDPVTGLQFQQNNLQGTLPNELTLLSKLDYLVLYENQLESVKGFENGFNSLRYLYLNDNPLQDHEYLFRLTNLKILQLVRTDFSGTLSTEIRQLSNLEYLDLGNNNLNGPIANRFDTMSKLQKLNLDDNQFTGTLDEILDCGGCTSTLQLLRSYGNFLKGSFPERLFEFTALTTLAIAKSRITGTIPSSIASLTALLQLDLYENYYFAQDNILPTELGLLTNLETLDVSDSVVGGTLPQELANVSSLQNLKIATTSLSGSIPEGICGLANMIAIEHTSGVDCTCTSCFLVSENLLGHGV